MDSWNTIEIQFGNRVRALRITACLSQEELGDVAELHRNYISDVERGRRNISLKNIEKLANALEVEIKELF